MIGPLEREIRLSEPRIYTDGFDEGKSGLL
jgi:hypothetical protein